MSLAEKRATVRHILDKYFAMDIDRVPFYNSLVGGWLSKPPWNYMATLSERAGETGSWLMPSIEQGAAIRDTTEMFFRRLSRSVYGRKQYRQDIAHATFFERISKSTYLPVHWHAHSLVWIDPKFDRGFDFVKTASSLWARISPGSAFIKHLSHQADVAAAARYITKYDHADGVQPIISSLPPFWASV